MRFKNNFGPNCAEYKERLRMFLEDQIEMKVSSLQPEEEVCAVLSDRVKSSAVRTPIGTEFNIKSRMKDLTNLTQDSQQHKQVLFMITIRGNVGSAWIQKTSAPAERSGMRARLTGAPQRLDPHPGTTATGNHLV